jgi:hypothetical protein
MTRKWIKVETISAPVKKTEVLFVNKGTSALNITTLKNFCRMPINSLNGFGLTAPSKQKGG